MHEYDFSPLIALYAEIRAEVIVTMQDLPEFQERLPTDDTLESSRPGYVSDNLLMDSVTDPLSDNLPYVLQHYFIQKRLPYMIFLF